MSKDLEYLILKSVKRYNKIFFYIECFGSQKTTEKDLIPDPPQYHATAYNGLS